MIEQIDSTVSHSLSNHITTWVCCRVSINIINTGGGMAVADLPVDPVKSQKSRFMTHGTHRYFPNAGSLATAKWPISRFHHRHNQFNVELLYPRTVTDEAVRHTGQGLSRKSWLLKLFYHCLLFLYLLNCAGIMTWLVKEYPDTRFSVG